jgi:indole-3-glycerol phosphate synthase
MSVSTGASAPDLLEAIVAATRRVVEDRRRREPDDALEARAAQRTPDGGAFARALADSHRINVIAECKRRSPSRGVLRADYDPVEIARGYERAGAAAISVLTEPAFFDGALAHLSAVREAVGVPLLRKDFILDRYQLLEARASGADAVLLIAAALSDRELASLHAEATSLGLAALVEVHDAHEVERALEAGAQIVGVNNRNLRTLEVDLRASDAAAARIPSGVIAVSESGLGSARDLDRLRQLGYRAFLIGERLMTAADPAGALAELLAAAGGGVRHSAAGLCATRGEEAP